MKKPSEIFKNIRFAKLQKFDKPHKSTDEEEHGAVGEIEWNQQLAHQKKRSMQEKVKEPTGELKDACWKGYTAVGMKMKNGRKVPNCVPVKEEVINEDDLPVTNKKSKTVTVKHKTSGKELNVVDTPSVREKYKTMGYHPVKEETQLDEISAETKASYTLKAKQQVADLQPHTKKGEYKDLAKNLIKKREKGIAMAKEEIEKIDELTGISGKTYKSRVSLVNYIHNAHNKVKEAWPRTSKSLTGDKKIARHNTGIINATNRLNKGLKKEAVDVPFEGGKKAKGTVTDKSGAKHTPMSRVKDIARKAMEKQMPKTKKPKVSNKTKVVKDTMKNAKSKDKFEPNPEMTGEINR